MSANSQLLFLLSNSHSSPSPSNSEPLRLEGITTSVGFDDILDITLSRNHQHFDHFIVVGKGNDRATRLCCAKHNATFVESHLFSKNGRNFNKGAAINQGFGFFQYYGWRLHLDSDILLPDNFRRVLFNHSHLDTTCLYHADRIDLVGMNEINAYIHGKTPQHHHNVVQCHSSRPVRERYVDTLYGFIPIGYFQLWNHAEHRSYPHGLGTAAHDDVLFAAQWHLSKRVLLPAVLVHHLCATQPQYMENWNGNRKQPRLDKK